MPHHLALGLGGRIPPNEQLMMNGLGLEEERRGRGQIIPAIGTKEGFYSFIFTHTDVRVDIDGVPEDHPANSLCVWDVRHRVYYGREDATWRLSWLQAWGTAIEKHLKQLKIPLNTPVTFPDALAMERCVVAVYDEFLQHSEPDIDLLVNRLEGLMLEARRQVRAAIDQRPPIPRNLQEAKRHMDRHCTQPIILAELARRAAMAPTYFCRRFRECYGSSPIRYLTERRLEHAKSCLRHPDISVQEAGEQAGYADVFNFSKIFKRHTGMSPRAYRRSLGIACSHGR